MCATENQEHKAIVKWLNLHPILKDHFIKIHNEGRRTEVQGWNLKCMGLRSGASDLFIYYPSNEFHGLFLEVKRNKKYSKSETSTKTWIAQETFKNNVKKVGYAYEICYGFEDGVRIINKYMTTP